jgi:preprotein translocase subunit YajC
VHETLTAVLLAATSTTAKKSSSSSSAILIVILVIAAAGYFFFIRPQQQKQRAARAEKSNVDVGDEILTVGGIVGRVVDVSGDRITIVSGEEGDEAAPGSEPTRLIVVKQAVARKIEPAEAAMEDEEDDEPEYDEDVQDRASEEPGRNGTNPDEATRHNEGDAAEGEKST